MQISETDHVLHPLDGGGVHGLDPPLGGEPELLPVIVHHLDPPALCRHHSRSDGDIELSTGDWFYPNVIALK